MSERLYTTQTPETDSNDPATKHTYGMRLTFSADGTVSAGRIWCPNPKPPTYFGWALWRVSDQALLSSVDLTAATLTAGAWNPVTLSGSVPVVSTDQYVVGAHYEGGHQVFSTTTVPFPLNNGAHITADTGMFINNATPSTYPSSTFALYAFADVEFDAVTAAIPAAPVLTTPARAAVAVSRTIVWLPPVVPALTTPPPVLVLAGPPRSNPLPGRALVAIGPAVTTAVVDCVVHRPATGTATRGATGTATRPNTGIVVRPTC